MQFSNNLKLIRLSRLMSQQEMADKLNITRAAYSAYERGLRRPDVDILYQIARILDVRVDFLYNTDDRRYVSTIEYYTNLCEAEKELVDTYDRLTPFSQGRLMEFARNIAAEDQEMFGALQLPGRNPRAS